MTDIATVSSGLVTPTKMLPTNAAHSIFALRSAPCRLGETPPGVLAIRLMSLPADRDQEIQTLRRRLGALEAQTAGLGLA
jgi:hypothetical protein